MGLFDIKQQLDQLQGQAEFKNYYFFLQKWKNWYRAIIQFKNIRI